MNRVRPLDRVRSIKLKFVLVLGASGGLGLAYFWWALGWIPLYTSLTAAAIGVLTSQLVAHGMTRPLREMTAAVRAMAAGDYRRRIRATSRDEVGQLAHAFNQMATDLAAADQQRRELIANVSHELRTPIAALRAVLENVVDGVSQADPATLRTALAQTERLGRLVTELLDLSRMEAGALRLERTVFAVEPLLAEVVAEAAVSSMASGRGTRFQVVVRPPGLTGYADRGRLYQVLANLLDNAARHGPAGGQVRVEAFGDGGDLVVEVVDEGPGIEPADRDRIFERFIRGGPAGGGTGLGLAIARWAVDLHGGRIAVAEPAPGETGCRIRVRLPDRPR